MGAGGGGTEIGCCSFWVIGDWCGRSCFALALFGVSLSFRVSFLVWSLVLRTLLYFSFVYPFEFRLLVRSLVLRTLLDWAVVLLTSVSYPA